MDPQRLIYLEERLAKIMSLARKHYVMPNELYQKHQDLLKELDELDCSDERLEEMAEQVELQRQKFLAARLKSSARAASVTPKSWTRRFPTACTN